MSPLDNLSTTAALVAFSTAWNATLSDYVRRRLNGEHTLQSSLYHHLRRILDDQFVIYTEAVVQMPDSHTEAKKKVVLDLLICHGTEIVVAVELKYTPRAIPTLESIRKDIKSLSMLRNRRSNADRVRIEMARYRSDDAEELTLTVSPLRKLVLGVYCQSELAKFDLDWWLRAKPDDGFWSKDTALPRNLGIAVACTASDGPTIARYIGGPFQRISGVVASEA